MLLFENGPIKHTRHLVIFHFLPFCFVLFCFVFFAFFFFLHILKTQRCIQTATITGQCVIITAGGCVSGLFIFVGFDPTLFLACTQALFYFSFRSFTKHRRARERSERGARERKITLPLPPCAGGAGQVFYRSYVLRHIRLQPFTV